MAVPIYLDLFTYDISLVDIYIIYTFYWACYSIADSLMGFGLFKGPFPTNLNHFLITT